MLFDFHSHSICETAEFGNYIAVNAVAVEKPLRIAFFTLSHHRVSEVRVVVEDRPNLLRWVDTQSREMFLRPLTLKAYRGFRDAINGKAYQDQADLYAGIRKAMGLVH